MKIPKFAYITPLLLLLAGCGVSEVPSPSTTFAPAQTTVQTIPTTAPTTVPPTEPTPVEERILETMSVEEKVGQLFLARCPETNAVADVAQYHLGGYILFGRDIINETPDSLRETIASYQSAASIPLLIAVDEEGGTVVRVSSNEAFRDSRFPSPRSLFDAGGMEFAIDAETEKAQLLHSVGFNVNMAPVCDITTTKSAFMYKRSLGQTPEVTGEFIVGTLAAYRENGIDGVLKHFPGYGNNKDTHTGIAVDERHLDELTANDLVPFSMGIQNGCNAILVSHTIIKTMDSELPATLSPTVITYLREEMGFSGVIVTDDLVMQAITDRYGDGQAAVMAVSAGCDLLCATNYQAQYTAVLEAVQNGTIPMDRLDSAVIRILAWKLQLKLLDTEKYTQ